jgi:predicted PurR-regulated permease PerM
MAKDRSSPLFILVAVITTIAALYIAKTILMPLALAILLTFLLTPVADRLERWRIPRVVAVVGVVGVSFAIVVMLGGIVTGQLAHLTLDLPNHELNLTNKIKDLRPESPAFDRVARTWANLRNAIAQGATTDEEFSNKTGASNDDNKEEKKSAIIDSETSGSKTKITVEPGKQPTSTTTNPANLNEGNDALEPSAKSSPLAIEVVAPSPSLFSLIQQWIGQLVTPLTTAGLVIVLVLFMLLDRENQRSRFVQLFGRSHMHATAEAVHDVAHRVGRYLRMLFLLNAGYGVVVAAGLWVIGVPGAVMWGVLGFSLRFLPYVGPWIAAAVPIAVSIATADGWTQPLLVVGWYIVIELISNNVVEPLVYGNSTGVSTVGVIVAAIFWTWLWGPIGLILSMPMTVCLLVAARYVPQLKFLTILLADHPQLSPGERVYQRLLASDYNEPLKLAHGYLKDSSLLNYYDEVLVPALVMAEHDRHDNLLNEDQAAFVFEATEDIIEELGEIARHEQQLRHAEAAVANSTATDVTSVQAHAAAHVLCIPLRDDADELASRMLAQILESDDFQVESGTAESLTSEMVDRVETSDIDVVVISILPPITPRDSRLLWKRLRSRYPDLPMVVGCWTAPNAQELLAEPVEDSASRVVTKLSEAVAAVRSIAAQVKLAAKTA